MSVSNAAVEAVRRALALCDQFPKAAPVSELESAWLLAKVERVSAYYVVDSGCDR